MPSFYFFKEVDCISFTELRTNSQIRVSEVRVIDDQGNSLGVMSVPDAVKKAEEKGAHDLGIKLEHANEFLIKGFKVKFVIRFRGREMEYKEQRGKEITDLIFKNVSLNGALEGEPFKEDKLIIFTIMPNKKPQ